MPTHNAAKAYRGR